MHDGRVVHFEDDPLVREIVADHLAHSEDHSLVGAAATLPDALEMLERIADGELDANVVVVDGSLSGVSDARDARIITKKIRKLELPLRVIGFSAEDLVRRGLHLDAFVLKGLPFDLARIIDELPDPEQLGTQSEDIMHSVTNRGISSATHGKNRSHVRVQPDTTRDFAIGDHEQPYLQVAFPPLMSAEVLQSVVPDLDLDKYAGDNGLLGQLASAAIALRQNPNSSSLQETLREAVSPLLIAVEVDNGLINEAAGRSENGLGSLVVGAVDIAREAATYWRGDGPLTVPLTDWPEIKYNYENHVSIADLLILRPDVASRIRIYSQFLL